MKKTKISFDFDDTLDMPIVQRFAKMLILAGHDVHIVTSRIKDTHPNTPKNWTNEDLYDIAILTGILKENIHFCGVIGKWQFFQNNPEFLVHLDDYDETVKDINNNTNTKAILFKHPVDEDALKKVMSLVKSIKNGKT